MINEEDLNELKVAKNLLENPGLAIKITNLKGLFFSFLYCGQRLVYEK